MEHDKIFNLQLIIQRLEEELILYRNGTTTDDLFNIINEKDNEIKDLKEKYTERDVTLRKLAKSSSEVVAKYDEALIRNKAYNNEINEYKSIIQNLNDNLDMKNNELENLVNKYNDQQLTIQMDQEKINTLTKQCLENSSYINDLEQELQDKNEELHDNIEELTKVTIHNDQNIELIYMKEQEIEKSKEVLVDSDTNIEKLQKRCALLVSEKNQKFKQLDQERKEMIDQIQAFRKSMEASIQQRDASLHRKDEKIKTLQLNISMLQQDNKMKTSKLEQLQIEYTSSRSNHNDVLKNMQNKLNEYIMKLQQYENQQVEEMESSRMFKHRSVPLQDNNNMISINNRNNQVMMNLKKEELYVVKNNTMNKNNQNISMKENSYQNNTTIYNHNLNSF